MTTAPTVKCDEKVLDEVREHLGSDLDREVGGFFVGQVTNGIAEVKAHIVASDALGSVASLTFTHEVWGSVIETVERDFPDDKLIGWYHSHPGHGVFLSEHDRFIQTNFFPADGMVAFVLDPMTAEEGWFETRDSQIAELSRSGGKPRAAVGQRPVSARGGVRSWRTVATAAVAAAIVAAVSYSAGLRAADEPASAANPPAEATPADDGEVRELRRQLDQARAELAAKEATEGKPAIVYFTYRVRKGDSLSRLASIIYGNRSDWQRIHQQNLDKIRDPNNLIVGTELLIPITAAEPPQPPPS